jgi:hypothetical protein
MGRTPLNPRLAALLPKWKNPPGMLGIRVEGWPTDGSADWFWPAVEKAGLPIMLLINGRSATLRSPAFGIKRAVSSLGALETVGRF